jgi:hypothetical protein
MLAFQIALDAVFPIGQAGLQAGLWAGKQARPGRTEHGLGRPRLEISWPAKPAGRPIGFGEYVIQDIFCISSLRSRPFIKNIIVQMAC